MIRNACVFLAAIVLASCVDASWLPWDSLLLGSGVDLQQAPNNDFNVHHFNESTICLRLSASISILVQYETGGVRDGAVQIIVPHLGNENIGGSCGPDAYLHVSWLPDEETTKSSGREEANRLKVEETSWSEPTTFADANNNSLRFEFVQQNDSYFLAKISGFVILNDVPEDNSTDSTVVEVSIPDLTLFEAPLGVVSMCYGKTLLEGEVYDNITAVSLVLTDVQLLAYHDESYWPYEATWCTSSPVVETDYTVAIVVGTTAAVVGVGLLGAFIYYLRTR